MKNCKYWNWKSTIWEKSWPCHFNTLNKLIYIQPDNLIWIFLKNILIPLIETKNIPFIVHLLVHILTYLFQVGLTSVLVWLSFQFINLYNFDPSPFIHLFRGEDESKTFTHKQTKYWKMFKVKIKKKSSKSWKLSFVFIGGSRKMNIYKVVSMSCNSAIC